MNRLLCFMPAILAVNFIFVPSIMGAPLQEKVEDSKRTKCNAPPALNSYPGEIADLIYAKTKDLPNHTQLSIALVHDNQTTFYGIMI